MRLMNLATRNLPQRQDQVTDLGANQANTQNGH